MMREAQLRKYLQLIDLFASLWRFFLINIDVKCTVYYRQCHPDQLVVLHCVIEIAQQALRVKPVSSILHGC